MPRRSNTVIDGSAIMAMLGYLQGAPDTGVNPAAGATGPGDVDYKYAGDPSEAIKKYGTGLIKTPSLAQRVAFPELANQIGSTNLQYQTNPAFEKQRFEIQKSQDKQLIAAGYHAGTGKVPTDAELEDYWGAYGHRPSGLGAEAIAGQEQGKAELKSGLPVAKASLAGQHIGLAARKATAEASQNLPEEETKQQVASAKRGTTESDFARSRASLQNDVLTEEMQNQLAREMKVTRSEIELAAKQVAFDTKMVPDVQAIKQQVILNQKYAATNVVPPQQEVEAGVAEAHKKALPVTQQAIGNQALSAAVASSQPPTLSDPRLFKPNPNWNPGDPITKAYSNLGANPLYNPLAKVTAMENNTQSGAGHGVIRLPSGEGFRLSPTPDAPVVAPPSTTPSTNQPTAFIPAPATPAVAANAQQWPSVQGAPAWPTNEQSQSVRATAIQALQQQIQNHPITKGYTYDRPGYDQLQYRLKQLLEQPNVTPAY